MILALIISASDIIYVERGFYISSHLVIVRTRDRCLYAAVPPSHRTSHSIQGRNQLSFQPNRGYSEMQ